MWQRKAGNPASLPTRLQAGHHRHSNPVITTLPSGWEGQARKEEERTTHGKGQSPSKNSRANPKRETPLLPTLQPPTDRLRSRGRLGNAWHPDPLLLSPNTHGPSGSRMPLHRTVSDTKPTAGHWTLLSTPLQRCSLTKVEKQRTVQQTHVQGQVYTVTTPSQWTLSKARLAGGHSLRSFPFPNTAPHSEASPDPFLRVNAEPSPPPFVTGMAEGRARPGRKGSLDHC